MSVNMKGGASGMRRDYLPPVPSSGASQPVLDTSTSGGSAVHLKAYQFKRKHAQTATADFMPTGGTVPEGSTDVGQQDIAGLGPKG